MRKCPAEPGLILAGLVSDSCVAHAVYKDAAFTPSNFGQLHLKTEGAYEDSQQMFGAGFAEGWLSADRIYDYYINTLIYFTDVMKEQLDKPLQWLEDQDQWARGQVSFIVIQVNCCPVSFLCHTAVQVLCCPFAKPKCLCSVLMQACVYAGTAKQLSLCRNAGPGSRTI